MDLEKENEILKKELEELRSRLDIITQPKQRTPDLLNSESPTENEFLLTIVIIGASGDLAKKKTFPSLFSLYLYNLLPQQFIIFGYARSPMSLEDFRKHSSQKYLSIFFQKYFNLRNYF